MKSPHQRFLESKFVKPHADLVVSDGFLAACEYAVLQFVEDQPPVLDPQKHWDCHAQLVGARRVLNILKGLADPIEENKPQSQQTLNYNSKK